MGSSSSILLVDDDLDLINILERILKEEGYQVTKAYDGDSALALLKKHKPDLIILDIMMPNVDGYTTCSIIKSNEATKEIPVIILTALNNKLNKELANEVGADGYIIKPFSSRNLLDTIAQFLLTSPE